MNVKFHISRYQALMILIAVLFLFLVLKALTYLPETEGDSQFLQNAKNKVMDMPMQEDTTEETAAKDTVTDAEENSDVPEDNISELLAEAEEYRLNKDYNNALATYLSIINKVDEPHQYAICYDGVTKIYIAQNNFEKALGKARLAYKYEPNDARKLTIARLYHKLGDTAQEQQIVNELLEADF